MNLRRCVGSLSRLLGHRTTELIVVHEMCTAMKWSRGEGASVARGERCSSIAKSVVRLRAMELNRGECCETQRFESMAQRGVK